MSRRSDDPVLDALLAEYESLRTESLQAIGHRIAATNFVFAAMAVIVAGLLGAEDLPRVLAAGLLLVGVPQFGRAGLLIWLGEYQRSQRAGRHLAELEGRINDHLGTSALGWERRLVSSSVKMGYPYVAVAVLLLGAAYVSELLGLYLAAAALADEAGTTAALVATAGALLAIVGAELRFHSFFRAKWREARGSSR